VGLYLFMQLQEEISGYHVALVLISKFCSQLHTHSDYKHHFKIISYLVFVEYQTTPQIW
jgi:hypothetical protein